MLKNMLSSVAVLLTSTALLTGCGGTSTPDQSSVKTFVYGTTAYGTAMENAGLNPHDSYCGWSAVRYGVGETLFRFNENMELEPWLATDYKQLDDYTLQINLRDDVYFSSNKKLTGQSVKKCLEDLIANHARAAEDLKIAAIEANDNSITITSKEKTPGLIYYLCDPYGAIVDMEAGFSDRIAVGTGPYIAQKITDTEINLIKNPNYWQGEPKLDTVTVKSIPDGDTLTMALQNGELDAAQGLPYASLPLFNDSNRYTISSCDTSRVYQAAINFKNPILRDNRVRRAISMAVDKDSFTKVLLNGNGTPAIGPFPANLNFGGNKVSAPEFNIQSANALLDEAGWHDSDGDGYRDKDGITLELRWLTYTSRQELPLFAEAAQASMQKVGIKLIVNATDHYRDFLKSGEYDIYAKAFVTAPTGDPQYYFTTHLLDSSSYNHGYYHNDTVEELTRQLRETFNPAARSELAIAIEQHILDDSAFIYGAHLKMSLVMKKDVTGFHAHPSDYYEITAALDKAK